MTPMTYSEHPVRSLQEMLRTLSFYYPDIPRVIPNGTFGEQTLAAVRSFQRQFGLPVTGIVDNTVWDALVLAYHAVSGRMSPPLQVAALPNWHTEISPGQNSVYFRLGQSIFNALASILEEISPGSADSGNNGAWTQNLRWLQEKGGLEKNGGFGREEWDLLTRLYTLFILRS